MAPVANIVPRTLVAVKECGRQFVLDIHLCIILEALLSFACEGNFRVVHVKVVTRVKLSILERE